MPDLRYAASLIRTIPDWPTPGIIFKDVTPLLADADALNSVIDAIADLGKDIDLVAGIEARGFILASAVASRLHRGFIPIRKKGKLPYKTHSQDYGLEYGSGTLEIHTDAIKPGQKVLLVDDVLATGGTLIAAIKLIQATGAVVTSVGVLLEIAALGGREKLQAAFPEIAIHAIYIV